MKQTNTRKRKWLAAGGLGMVAALVCLGILSGTLARYTFTDTLSDTARVAKFDVSIGNGSREFKLFDTIYDTDGSGEETHVEEGSGKAIIAPGTTGNFDLVLNNNSEVTVEYTVKLSVDSTAIPLEFSTDNGTTWTKDLTTATATNELDMGDSETVTVQWRWIFNGDDTVDTQLGTDAKTNPAEVKATAEVSFVQVD